MTPLVLFHWSPASRRKLIAEHGLLIRQEPTTCEQGIDYLCLSPDPASAWNLSARMPWSPAGEWDLWQVRLDSEYDVRLRVEDGQLLEVKVPCAIGPGRLWRVGSRNVAAEVPTTGAVL